MGQVNLFVGWILCLANGRKESEGLVWAASSTDLYHKQQHLDGHYCMRIRAGKKHLLSTVVSEWARMGRMELRQRQCCCFKHRGRILNAILLALLCMLRHYSHLPGYIPVCIPVQCFLYPAPMQHVPFQVEPISYLASPPTTCFSFHFHIPRWILLRF